MPFYESIQESVEWLPVRNEEKMLRLDRKIREISFFNSSQNGK
jgi:hypothetical protein